MMKAILKTIVLGLTLVVTLTTAHGEILFSDNFSGATINPPTFAKNNAKWVIDHGAFKTDGTAADGSYQPTSGELNFGPTVGTKIHVDLDSAALSSLLFTLRQSNGAQGCSFLFTIRLEDAADSESFYDLKLSLNPGYFSKTGVALYAKKDLVKLGTDGAAIQLKGGPADSIKLLFDVVGGVTLSMNGVEVLTAPNSLKLTKINRISLLNETGTVSYFVDNILIEGSVP